jgi:glycerophosphoryl diester phosphodiesterase
VKRQLFIFILVISICSCGGDQTVYGDSETIALGHGGNGFIGFFGMEAPNSYQSVISALSHPDSQGIEVDCQILADGTLVLYHDQYFDSQTHCQGEVARSIWPDVSECKYDLIIESDDNRLWTFDGLLDYVHKRDVTISLDIKMYVDGRKRDSLFVEYQKAITLSLDQSDFQGDLFIESTSHKLLSHLKKENLPASLYFYAENYEEDVELAVEKDFDGLSISNDKITADQVARAQATGLRVMIFGARNEKLNLEVLAKKPDYLQTDDLEHIHTMIYSSDEN